MEYNNKKNNKTNNFSYNDINDILKYIKRIESKKNTLDDTLDSILIICDSNDADDTKKIELIKKLIETLKLYKITGN